MKPRVKICGITSLEDARFCSGAGADYLGFVQHKFSPRYIKPSGVSDIKQWLHGIQTVGVFVDEELDELNTVSGVAKFDAVQLHGRETAAYCRLVEKPVIKTLHVNEEDSLATLASRAEPYFDSVDFFLFDTGGLAQRGGTGINFDWNILASHNFPRPFFLAGGLNPDNVGEAIDLVAPWGLDVSSGLEDSPGKKDFELVRKFFERIEMQFENDGR